MGIRVTPTMPWMFSASAAALLMVGLTASRAVAAPSDGPTPVSVRASATNDIARYQFGPTSLLDEPQLVHTFRLRNDGATPLTLETLVPSCHCTTAALDPDGPMPTLAPGQQASVRVTVMEEPYMTGTLVKSVTVFAKGIPDPIATLEVDATLSPSVSLTPDTLDFGTVAAGQPRSQTLTATLDARLLPDGRTPPLLTSDPDVHVEPVSANKADGFRVFTYRVTLAADAALGPVRDLVHFAPSAGGTAALSLADGPSVPVMGQVAGAATAEPSRLSFGVVSRGHPTVRTIALTAQDTAVWMSATVASDSRWVTARLTSPASAHRTLAVTLDPAAPAGSLEAQVTVTLANGQRLRLPVTAYVSTNSEK